MQTYRVAMVGCGPRGSQQAAAYQAHPRTAVVALCDLDTERLNALGEELGVAARYLDMHAMMRQEAPDIVCLPTGTEFHHTLSLAALGHGCNIDVEKPLGVDCTQADDIVRQARQMGVRAVVHHQTRVGAAYRAVTAAIEAGRIGEVIGFDASDKGYYGGYGLMNIGTHLITNMVGLAGHCRAVSAVANTGGDAIDPDDAIAAPGGMGTIAGENLHAFLEFDRGVLGVLRHQRWRKVFSSVSGLEIRGSEGRIWMRSGGAWCLPQQHWTPEVNAESWQRLPLVHHLEYDPQGPAHSDELWYVDEYVRALDEDRAHPCSAVEAAHTVEVMMGVLESAAYGRRVELPQPLRDHPLLRWRREHQMAPPSPVHRDYGPWLAAEDRRLAGNTLALV